MASVNKVILIGNLGKDPEIRYTPNGVPVATFSIATSEKWTDKEGVQQENTEWHRCVAWRKTAEIADKYLKKGGQVYIEGKLKTRSWDQDGIKRYMTEITVDRLVLLGGRSGGSSVPAPSDQDAPPAWGGNGTKSGDGGSDDDLPF